MVTLNVFDPSGATEITRLHASRLAALANKNIALLSDDMWQAHRMLPVIREYLQAAFPDIEVIFRQHPVAFLGLMSSSQPSCWPEESTV